MSELDTLKNHIKYEKKQLLAIDYGSKVIGLSCYMPGRDPFPLCAGRILFKNNQQVITELQKKVDEEGIDVIILGVPYRSDGSESDMTKTVLTFANLIEDNFKDLEINLQDEGLTSYSAKEFMKSSPRFDFKVDPKKIDEVSACIILEDFLRSDGYIE